MMKEPYIYRLIVVLPYDRKHPGIQQRSFADSGSSIDSNKQVVVYQFCHFKRLLITSAKQIFFLGI